MPEKAANAREAIRKAAIAELIARGIDDFTVKGVATLAGVDPSDILQIWHDRRVLLMDAQLSRASQALPLPNTGSLRGDLLEYAAGLAELSASRGDRAWLRRTLPSDQDADLSEVRSDYWQARFDSVVPITQRAGERGELRDGVDPMAAIRMFNSALVSDPIFFDTAIDPEYAAQVIDIFIRGITR